MSIESEVLGVTRAGNAVTVSVVYRAGPVEFQESLVLAAKTTVEKIREQILELGRNIMSVSSIEDVAKTLVGEKAVIEPKVVSPKKPKGEKVGKRGKRRGMDC